MCLHQRHKQLKKKVPSEILKKFDINFFIQYFKRIFMKKDANMVRTIDESIEEHA
jgi:hypothetical protein